MTEICETHTIEDSFGIGKIDYLFKVFCVSCGKDLNDEEVYSNGSICPHCASTRLIGIVEYRDHVTGRIKYARPASVQF